MKTKEYLKLKKDITGKTEAEVYKMISELLKLDLSKPKYINDEFINNFLEDISNPTDFATRFIYDNVEYGFIPNLDNITTGEFIDLQQYSEENDVVGMMTVLYRPIKKKYKDLYTIEKYNDKYINDERHREVMENVDYKIGNGALSFFFNFRQGFIEPYTHIFTKVENTEEEQLNTSLEQAEKSFNERYSWYSMLYLAANEKYLKMDSVTKTPASNFLTFINYYIEKNKIEIQRIKQNN